ncbi:DinB family protein [Lewinella sp. JB7]|uniref:DinB family protein n=1 Tax=Lewinella sp. JB7 TaxID=2962887 RepID=UPI0020C97205|nr:DinB family protein [Lewinella sp. JB7]MCP9237192.1 DinB family protein [Lewinella sp. JB7]
MVKRNVLSPAEYAPFYAGYIDLVPADITLRTSLDDSAALLTDYLTNLPDEKVNHAYASGKWTVKEALQHIIDAERIFAYRALCLGRHDATPLPAFEHTDYALWVDVTRREFERMIEEFRTVRKSTISLFNSFSETDLSFTGTVSEMPMTCRAMGFVISGHTYHHNNIFRERY